MENWAKWLTKEMNKIEEYKNKINFDVWEDISNTGSDVMRESTHDYYLRRMREARLESDILLTPQARKEYETLNLQQQNTLLRNNVKELQGRLQEAYKRIKDLRGQKEKQLEFDI